MITRLTRAGADFGGISIPLGRSLAFGVGVHISTSAAVRPPPSQAALAPAGRRARTASAATAANPALSLELFLGKPILLRRPTGLAVGLARKEPAPPPYMCLLYTSPSPRDGLLSRMPSSA